MKDEDLIRMANQIADFFAPYGEEEAAEGVADHLKKFWEPRMRSQLLAIDEAGRAALKPSARRALELLRDQTTSPAR